MDWSELVYRLYLHNDPAVNEQIDTVAAIEPYPVIYNRQRFLSLNPDISFHQLVDEACFIRRFEQAGPESAMHSNRGANDLIAECVDVHFAPFANFVVNGYHRRTPLPNSQMSRPCSSK